METKKNTPFPYIAGGIFAFLALMQLANFHLALLPILWLAGYILTAAALFMKRRDILPVIGLAVLTLYAFSGALTRALSAAGWTAGATGCTSTCSVCCRTW